MPLLASATSSAAPVAAGPASAVATGVVVCARARVFACLYAFYQSCFGCCRLCSSPPSLAVLSYIMCNL
eukprot:1130119-Pleurochrysis_carterae.AAC.4